MSNKRKICGRCSHERDVDTDLLFRENNMTPCGTHFLFHSVETALFYGIIGNDI